MNYNDEEYESVDDVLEEIEQSQADQEAAEDAVETVLSNAIERIEEANIWKLLISQDVIEAGSGSERVVRSVNSQLKKFGLERLELLLGMREPKVEKAPQVIVQFDNEEERALKVLAAKVLGRSIASVVISSENQPKVAKVAPEVKEPKLKTVNAPQQRQPALAQSHQQQLKSKPKAKAAPSPKSGGGRTNVPANAKADQGYALPVGAKPIPMPRADSLGMNNGYRPAMAMTVDPGLNPGYGTQSTNILGNLIQQLAGGNPMHVDNSAPMADMGENVNERF